MPKVQQYGESKVAPSVTPSARMGNQQIATVGDLAPGLNEVGRQFAIIGQRIDDTEAEEALNGFEREKNDLFFNPESGYFNSQGRTAYDGAKTTSDKLTELQQKYATNLKSPRARDAFSKASGAMLTRSNADIMRHASQNLTAWQTATINARAENTLENAALYWQDDERLQIQNALGRQSVMDAAKLQGIDGEALNEKLQTYDSAFAKSVVHGAINKSSTAAKQAMDKYGNLLEGPDKLDLDEKIKAKAKAEETQNLAGQSVLLGGNLVSRYGDADNARSQILDEINKIADPKLRKETSEEAMRQLDLRKRAVNEERSATYESGENFLLNGGTVAQFKAQNPAAWEKLDADQKRKLTNGTAIVTDYEKFNSLMMLPKDQLAAIDPSEYTSMLAPGDRDKLRNAVLAARKGEGEDSQSGRTRAMETSGTVRQIFGNPPTGGYKADKLEQVNAFYSVVSDEASAREKQKGSALTSKEYTDLLNDMSRKYVKKGFIFDSKLSIADIPAADVQVLSDYLHRNNIPVTGDNLIRAYQQAQKK